MKKTGLYGHVYDFSVDYNAIAVGNILDIHTYVMKKNDIKSLDLLKKMFITVTGFTGSNANVNPKKCVSISNQGCRVRSAIMNINSNEPLFYPYTVLLNKCSDNP